MYFFTSLSFFSLGTQNDTISINPKVMIYDRNMSTLINNTIIILFIWDKIYYLRRFS